MGKRRRARELALQMLFQSDLGGAAADELFAAWQRGACRDDEESAEAAASATPDALESEAFDYARALVLGTLSHLAEIDELLRRQAENWRLERMSAVDRNILRLAVFELLHEVDVPKLVIVDEAVELAKRFGSDQSSRFVNGLLDGIMRSQSLPGSRS